MAHPFYLADPFAVTPRAGVAFKDDHTVRSNVRARMFSVTFVYCFEVSVCTDKYPLSLVIEIRAFNDMFEVFHCIHFGAEYLPVRSVLSEVFRARKLRQAGIFGTICKVA